MPTVEETLTALLDPFNVEIRFSQKAVEDLIGYQKEQQEKILALIVARAKKRPLIKPNGIGEPLHGEFAGFAKIKPKQLGLRVICRPVRKTRIIMEIIAIGPRDRDKVYTLAAKRLKAFLLEMSQRNEAGNTRKKI